MKILIVTAVMAEREAVLRGLEGSLAGSDLENRELQVLVGGVGPVSAAVSTAKALAQNQYSLVISAGIGGGFPGQAELGQLVLADQVVAPELGVESPAGFIRLEELGFGSSRIQVQPQLLAKARAALVKTILKVKVGPVLTVTTATGTDEGMAELLRREPRAMAEAMEGFGVAWAAQDYGVPFLELRAISNPVGLRDRASWKITEALAALETASGHLWEAWK